MKNSLLFTLFFVLLINFACSSNPNSQSNKYNPNTDRTLNSEVAKIANLAPSGTPYNFNYSKPEIGMGITEFMFLCRKPDSRTDSQSAKGTITVIKNAFSESRAKNECWGTFTFGDDSKLSSISRQ